MTPIADLTGAPDGRRYPAGAEPVEGGFSLRVWAPGHKSVEVHVEGGEVHQLARDKGGYFSAILPLTTGQRYWLTLDAKPERLADPASRFQPEGPRGPSELVDPRSFAWTDKDWRGLNPHGQVFYELHIGTFTPEGTWDAAIGKLPHLKELGVTAIELMPLNEFDARFGWGYDGVLLYAPTRLYGRPDDVRRFVDAAHAHGLGVVLDVVYNHFGAGDKFETFSPHYFTDDANEWGRSINFSHSAQGSRDYFVGNALYWIDEFHMDGLRIDAAHAMVDDESKEHVVAEIVRKARAVAGERGILITGESEPQDARLARPQDRGGYGLDAIWNEDFHHSAVAAATARNEAYLHDHVGAARELLATAKYGLLYQGQRYDWQDAPRGSNAFDLRPQSFVNYLQNHDQIANSATGERFWQRTSPAMARAMTAFFLLVPENPLLFMGQEFAASTPFFYFLGTEGRKQVDQVESGRLEFLQQFQSMRDPESSARMARPDDERTFARSKLDWTDAEGNAHILALHRDLLALRRTDPAISRQPSPRDGMLDGNLLSEDALLLRYFADEPGDHRLLLVNFGRDLKLRSIPDPLTAPPTGLEWMRIWSSEDVRYGGDGRREMDLAERFTLTGECAVLFGLTPARPREGRRGDDLKHYQHELF